MPDVPDEERARQAINYSTVRAVRDAIAADDTWSNTVTLAVLNMLVDPHSTAFERFDEETAKRLRVILLKDVEPRAEDQALVDAGGE